VKAILTLADGTTYEGASIGATGRAFGEVVFNTSMTGYQEILTDPSYKGQIVALTYPLIGNYGVNDEDVESIGPQVAGFIVKEMSDEPSNFRCKGDGDSFLKRHGIVGIEGVDVRALTRKLRNYGVLMGGISTMDSPDELLRRVREAADYGTVDFVSQVTTPRPYGWRNNRPDYQLTLNVDAALRVVVLDCGVKYNIHRSLTARGCDVVCVPCHVSAEDILAFKPDGVVLSPGPGDPALLGHIIAEVKKLIGRKPIFGICLGNQLLGWALGGKTYKLKFGHRGANHPVKDFTTGRVYITSQNHGYAVDADSLTDPRVVVSHINLNDNTVEGLRHTESPIMSVQYHPEASPGPRDNGYLFDRFIEMIRSHQE
jgi:carbamoyl-phosphate synthase small subunit